MTKKVSKVKSGGATTVSGYIKLQKPEYAKICRALSKEFKETLPKTTSKLYHGFPVWFVGENAVVGFRVTPKKGVNLLFWNGQAFNEPELKATGSFEAAEIHFQDVKDIDAKKLRKWAKKAGKDIWDFAGLRKQA
ncbi:MAG: DUF1801 domain-containing protein [Bdellovibrionia bacterium]